MGRLRRSTVERRRAPRRTATRLPLTRTVAWTTLEPRGTLRRIENLRRLTHFLVEGSVTSFEKTGSAAAFGTRLAVPGSPAARPAA